MVYTKVCLTSAFIVRYNKIALRGKGLLSADDGWTGIGPKVTQSVITAAFLFAFKDALYDASVKLRRKVPAQLPVR